MAAIPNLTMEARCDLARDYAVLAAVAAGLRSGLPAADARSEADLAIAALHQAVAAGYRDLDQLRKDRDLVPLRPRADFQLLMMDVAMPADPLAAARWAPGPGREWRSSRCARCVFRQHFCRRGHRARPAHHSWQRSACRDTHSRISYAVRNTTLRRGLNLLRNPPIALYQHLLD
jgi:hypothetical protein